MNKTILLLSLIALVGCNGPITEQDSTGIIIENDEMIVLISPRGAELQSIQSKRNHREYLWHGDPDIWGDRAPVMFPVNVHFKDDQYTYKGKRYEMPFLGLAYRRSFKVISSDTKNVAVFELDSNEQTLQHYPFPFRFRVRYQLDGNKLINEFSVENTGTETLYYALGGHPGFTFITSEDAQRSDYQLTFSKSITMDRPIISGGLWQGQHVSFLKDDTCLNFDDPRIPQSGMFLKDSPARQIGVGLKNEEPFVTVDLGTFPNVNLWSLPGRPFVCIEPMVSHHDSYDSPMAIEEKKHMETLSPGKTEVYRFVIQINPDAET